MLVTTLQGRKQRKGEDYSLIHQTQKIVLANKLGSLCPDVSACWASQQSDTKQPPCVVVCQLLEDACEDRRTKYHRPKRKEGKKRDQKLRIDVLFLPPPSLGDCYVGFYFALTLLSHWKNKLAPKNELKVRKDLFVFCSFKRKERELKSTSGEQEAKS